MLIELSTNFNTLEMLYHLYGEIREAFGIETLMYLGDALVSGRPQSLESTGTGNSRLLIV